MSDAGQRSTVQAWRAVGARLARVATPAMAVACLITIGGILVWADWLESRRGREWVQWHIYDSLWFSSLLGLAMMGATLALFRRRTWRWRNGGQVLAHIGMVVLLVGAGWSQYGGAAGTLVLSERQTAERVPNRARTQIAVDRASGASRRSSQFSFAPGVEDWPDGKQVEFPAADGVALRVIDFVRFAQPQVDWVPAEDEAEAVALRVLVRDSATSKSVEEWLTASAYGGELYVGAARFVLWPIYLETMVADFLDPPTDLGVAGVLSVHYAGHMVRFRIDDVRGQTVPIGDTGASVEFVDYLPDAKPQPDGRKFISRSTQPKNPVLELRVHLPNEPEPLRQLAFAKSPLLNLDGVLRRTCPVRFWYHHAGLLQQAGVVFAQTPTGVLYARRVVDGRLADPIEVQVHAALNITGPSNVTVVRHLPQARREVTFTPASPESATGRQDSPEAAVQVELTVDGTQRTIWLSRGENEFSYQVLATSAGLASVSCGYQQLALDSQVELAQLIPDPAAADDKKAWEACVLNVRKSPGDPPMSNTVATNQPLQLGAFRLCLTGFQELSQGRPAAVFAVSRDPGRLVKYLGCALLLSGLAWLACTRVSSNGEQTRRPSP